MAMHVSTRIRLNHCHGDHVTNCHPYPPTTLFSHHLSMPYTVLGSAQDLGLAFDQSNDRANRTFRSFSNGGRMNNLCSYSSPLWEGGEEESSSRWKSLLLKVYIDGGSVQPLPVFESMDNGTVKEHPFPKWWNCFERGRISLWGGEGVDRDLMLLLVYVAIRWYPPYWFRGWFVRRAIVGWTILPVSLFLNLGTWWDVFVGKRGMEEEFFSFCFPSFF